MSRDRDRSGKRPDHNQPSSARKAYQKPEILSRESIEVMAVACNPNDPIPGKADPGTCGNLTS